MIAKLITGVAADVTFPACHMSRVRVAGTAALAGAVLIKQGATTLETLPIGTAVGVERDYAAGGAGTKFDPNLGLLTITMANVADSILVLFN
jgi:hypothetical protein